MKKVLNKFFFWGGISVVAGSFFTIFLAVFIRSYSPITGITYDGLGRQLIDTPAFARIFLGEESLWPGWKFFLIDTVGFWIAIGVAYGFIMLSKRFDVKALR